MAEVRESEDFTLTDLVDLALCSPEIGAVNFNILRVVLHELVGSIGGDSIHPHLDDVQANQIQNFKNYIQGAGTASPMPGVLRYNPPGFQFSGKNRTPRTPRTEQLGAAPVESTMSVGVSQDGNMKSGPDGTKMTGAPGSPGASPRPPGASPRLPQAQAPSNNTATRTSVPSSRDTKELESKVARLERHLEALYALPTNQQILDGSDTDKPAGMSVNDMWQIIQLNNRVAAAEAAIQKMASLIEDLARGLKTIKTSRASTDQGQSPAVGAAPLSGRSDQGADNYEPFNEKCEEAKRAVDVLKSELDTIKNQWKNEMSQLANATGQAISKVALAQQQQQRAHQQQTQGGGHGQHTGAGTGQGQAPGQGQGQGQQASGQVQGQNQPVGQGQGQQASGQVQGQNQATGQGQQAPGQQQAEGQGTGKDQTTTDADAGAQSGASPAVQQQGLQPGQAQDKSAGAQPPVPPGQQPPGNMYPDQQGIVSQAQSTVTQIEVPKADPKTQARVGAAEAAIRKMGNLIEELAKELKAVKHDRKASKGKEGEPTTTGKIDPQVMAKMEPIKNKCEEAKKAVDVLKGDLEHIKKQWKDDIEKLQHGQKVMRQSLVPQPPHNLLPPRQAGHIPGQPAAPGEAPSQLQTLGGAPPVQGIQAVQQALGAQPSADTSAVLPTDESTTAAKTAIKVKIGQRKEDSDILHHLKTPLPKVKAGDKSEREKERIKLSKSDEALLQQEQPIIILPKDLDELREKVKAEGKVSDVFDELEILEKVATLWEAVDVLKRNQESMAVRLLKLDASVQKIPGEHLDALQQIPVGSLAMLASSDRVNLKGTRVNNALQAELQNALVGKGQTLPAEDMQTIFTNLNSLLAESDDQRDRVEQLYDIVQHLESIVVTKPMLVDAMGDKADKGQMNTKVSYDEFGNAVDELTNKIQNLLIEVYQKNEGWKRITDQLIEEMGDKLDKYEIGPLRAYFKSHLGDLESQVAALVKQFNEPDPAGTRKKILRDFNCISCDRHTNISGITNASILPCIGPILAGHTTASQRAYDLYNMRNAKRYDAACDLNAIERTNGNRLGRVGTSPQVQSVRDSEMTHVVNRYVGGSHTAVSNAERVAAFTKRPSTTASPKRSVPGQFNSNMTTVLPTPSMAEEQPQPSTQRLSQQQPNQSGQPRLSQQQPNPSAQPRLSQQQPNLVQESQAEPPTWSMEDEMEEEEEE